MSTEPETASIDPVVRPFIELWAAYAKQADDSTRQLLEGFNGSASAKRWQRRWYDALSQSTDAYMRSPMFLAAMKQNADAVIKAKQQTDDLAAEFARNANIPTANDISGLFERLHSVEEVIVSRLGRIEERLAAIEQRVGGES